MTKFLLSAALVGALVALPLSAAAGPTLSGKVVFVDGEATADGRLLDIGDQLTGTVTLKTGKAAVLEVVFGERNIFRLGADTVARVDLGALNKSVTLEKGAFTSVLKKLAKATGGDPSFVLRTATLNAGVRGTSFHVSVEGHRTYFCTCNGSVDLHDAAGAQEVVLENAHHGARVYTKADDGSITVAPAGIEGHGDASIVSLAQKIGETVDWTKPDLSSH